jgi:hypothetical protein
MSKSKYSPKTSSVGAKREWEAWEDDSIRKLHREGKMHKEIAAAIGRPVGSIGGRIFALKLSRKAGEEKVENRIGTIIRKGNVTIHYAKQSDDRKSAQLRRGK